MVEILFITVIFLSEIFIGAVSIVDVVLIITMTGLLLFKSIKINKKDIGFVLVLMFFAILPYIFYKSKAYFDQNRFYLSLLKQLLYLLSLLIIPKKITNKERFMKTITLSINVVLIFSIFKFLLFNLIPGGQSIILNFFPKSISYGSYRETGVYSEPAGFSSLSILFFFVMFYDQTKIKKTTHFVFFIVLLMSQSITAIGIHLIGYLFYYVSKHKFSIKTIFVFVFAFSLMTLITLRIPLFQRHIDNLLTFNNSSAVTRIYGGVEFVYKTPFVGVGFGNIENYVLSQTNLNTFKYLSTSSGTITNVFAAIKGYYGFLGLLVFIYWLIIKGKDKNNMFFVLFFILWFFSTGTFNDFSFFSILVLLFMIDSNKVNNYER